MNKIYVFEVNSQLKHNLKVFEEGINKRGESIVAQTSTATQVVITTATKEEKEINPPSKKETKTNKKNLLLDRKDHE